MLLSRFLVCHVFNRSRLVFQFPFFHYHVNTGSLVLGGKARRMSPGCYILCDLSVVVANHCTYIMATQKACLVHLF